MSRRQLCIHIEIDTNKRWGDIQEPETPDEEATIALNNCCGTVKRYLGNLYRPGSFSVVGYVGKVQSRDKTTALVKAAIDFMEASEFNMDYSSGNIYMYPVDEARWVLLANAVAKYTGRVIPENKLREE
jgi:hypothetical protein